MSRAAAPVTFATERMRAARPAFEDEADYCRLMADARVARTLTRDGQPMEQAAARTAFAARLADWEAWGFGVWIARLQADGRFVGYCGLRRVDFGDGPTVELAYGLAADCWGLGLATELARPVLALGSAALALPEVVAITLVTNRPSQRVMEKAGLRFRRPLIHAGLPHVLYAS